MSALTVIRAQWPSPSHVHAFTTTRQGGFSKAPFDGFNLGAYAGDELEAVLQNRRVLDALLPQSPYWIKQVHGTRVVKVQASSIAIGDFVSRSRSTALLIALAASFIRFN